MATIESLTTAIRAALDKASECLAGLADSKELTESLRDRLQGLGFENTATDVSGIAAELEAAQTQATTIVDRLESASDQPEIDWGSRWMTESSLSRQRRWCAV
jgi:DNA repair ATPase RecN